MGSKTQKEHGNSTHPTFLLSVFGKFWYLQYFVHPFFYHIPCDEKNEI